jgi:hypothetical protein
LLRRVSASGYDDAQVISSPASSIERLTDALIDSHVSDENFKLNLVGSKIYCVGKDYAEIAYVWTNTL